MYQPKWFCINCGSKELEEVKLSGEGRIVTWTTVYVPPVEFKDEAPYIATIIRLDEGLHIPGFIKVSEGENVDFDRKVKFVGVNKQGGFMFKLLKD